MDPAFDLSGNALEIAASQVLGKSFFTTEVNNIIQCKMIGRTFSGPFEKSWSHFYEKKLIVFPKNRAGGSFDSLWVFMGVGP